MNVVHSLQPALLLPPSAVAAHSQEPQQGRVLVGEAQQIADDEEWDEVNVGGNAQLLQACGSLCATAIAGRLAGSWRCFAAVFGHLAVNSARTAE